MLTVLATKFST